MGLFSFTQEVAIDLGTANTIITCNDKMVVEMCIRDSPYGANFSFFE